MTLVEAVRAYETAYNEHFVNMHCWASQKNRISAIVWEIRVRDSKKKLDAARQAMFAAIPGT